jgi:hypothetical protein
VVCMRQLDKQSGELRVLWKDFVLTEISVAESCNRMQQSREEN